MNGILVSGYCVALDGDVFISSYRITGDRRIALEAYASRLNVGE
jgi:hypothetical protein